ncbi:sigma-70 family RNA polymerase sigma factor [Pedobacter hiemivivus]|uniref:Sigma-70 family RNA polymerase sigma factor n=1 Tax=Pedobacter hiemivivus TaxID=2530454 RepID=A0A4U1G802_9SPHI|nr:sigma-70 family RNA polymerase sigma factor [Pedobacter hiemivivus]TKC59991.1 sigma-70 family RNA polymerase sigma factor [Pedobacter hiemivivus]
MHVQKFTDAELWDAIKNNELKAFNILFDRYWSAIYKTAYNYNKDPEVCTEITHDIFLNIWNKRQSLEIHAIKAYLISSARYHVYKRERRVRAIDLKYVGNYIGVQENTTQNTAEEHFNYNELKTKINSYLEELPHRSKEIFLLSREEHLSNEEIADRLCISKRTVENQITNALKHLRISLKHFGIVMILFKL